MVRSCSCPPRGCSTAKTWWLGSPAPSPRFCSGGLTTTSLRVPSDGPIGNGPEFAPSTCLSFVECRRSTQITAPGPTKGQTFLQSAPGPQGSVGIGPRRGLNPRFAAVPGGSERSPSAEPALERPRADRLPCGPATAGSSSATCLDRDHGDGDEDVDERKAWAGRRPTVPKPIPRPSARAACLDYRRSSGRRETPGVGLFVGTDRREPAVARTA